MQRGARDRVLLRVQLHGAPECMRSVSIEEGRFEQCTRLGRGYFTCTCCRKTGAPYLREFQLYVGKLDEKQIERKRETERERNTKAPSTQSESARDHVDNDTRRPDIACSKRCSDIPILNGVYEDSQYNRQERKQTPAFCGFRVWRQRGDVVLGGCPLL